MLGAGSFGIVREAVDRSTGRKCACIPVSVHWIQSSVAVRPSGWFTLTRHEEYLLAP